VLVWLLAGTHQRFPQNASARLGCLFLRCFAPFSVADGFGCWRRWSSTKDRHFFFGPEARISLFPICQDACKMKEADMRRRDVTALTAGGGYAVPRLKFNRSARLGVQLALLTVSYYFAARLGFGFRFQGPQVGIIGIIWPANALLLAALVLTPRRRWWLVLIATAVAHTAALWPAVPVWRLAWQIAGNAVFTVVTAEVLGRIAGPVLHLGNRRQVVTYVAISFVSPLLFTLATPAFVRSWFHFERNLTPATALTRLTLSNATAFLLVAPVVLLWARYGVRRSLKLPMLRVLEAAIIMFSLLAVGLFAFNTEPETALFPALLLLFFPPLLWAAVRFGPMGASTSLLGVAAMSIWGTARHLGPFVLTTNTDRVLSLQMFWIVLCVPVMLLAGVIREREEVEQRLRESQDQMNRDYEHVSALARRLMGAREDERKRIAGELHDDVSQKLALQIAVLELEREQQTAAELEAVARLQEVGMRCLQTGYDFQGSLSAILDAAIFLANAAKGNMQLSDPFTGGLTLVAQRGFEKPFLDCFRLVTHPSTASGVALATRERVIIEDVLESEIFAGTPGLQVVLDAGVRAVQSTPLISSSGKVLGMITTHYSAPHRPREREVRLMDLLARLAADYLERKQAEEALAASSAQLRRFLEAAPTGLLRCSRDLRYLSANSAYAEIAGLPVEQIVGRLIVDVIGPDAWETIRPYVERVQNGERVEFETVVPYAAAGPRQIHVVGVPEKEGEEVVGWVGAVTDITEFKRVEKQLQEVEKVAAAGQLAASLAHEINNPLEAVINVLYLLAGRSDLDPTATGLISIANNEVTRVARIVRQSLSYYRAGTMAREVDLAALIEESLQVFSDKFQRAGIAIGKKIKPGTRIIGFADEIRQVVDNLLVNAVEATPRGGRLALALRQSRCWKNHSQLGARLTIADNGCGIPKTHLARIFEPFFTTKAEKGTGLGLWVVKGIVKKHGGSLRIRSTDAAARSGTVICIFWPYAVKAHPTNQLARSEHAA
jgi:PAS domain S-box-containing protein